MEDVLLFVGSAPTHRSLLTRCRAAGIMPPGAERDIACVRRRLAAGRPGMVVVATGLLARELRALAAAVEGRAFLVLLLHGNRRADPTAMARVGVRGLLLDTDSPHDLFTAVREARRGRYSISPGLLTRLVSWEADGRCRRGRMEPLTERESEVLDLLALGYSSAAMAAKLCVSMATVRSHVLHILRKLNVRTRAQAVAIAYHEGWVVPGGGTPAWDTAGGSVPADAPRAAAARVA